MIAQPGHGRAVATLSLTLVSNSNHSPKRLAAAGKPPAPNTASLAHRVSMGVHIGCDKRVRGDGATVYRSEQSACCALQAALSSGQVQEHAFAKSLAYQGPLPAAAT